MNSGTTINPMAAKLAAYKLDPPASIRIPRIRKAAKRCYELSGKFALEHPDATVVQGFVGKFQVKHAWAEIDGMVYDGTCKGLFDRDGYYLVTHAVAVCRLSAQEYAEIVCTSGYWQPCRELVDAERAGLECEA